MTRTILACLLLTGCTFTPECFTRTGTALCPVIDFELAQN